MRELMRQTGERGQSRICVDPVPRQGVCAEEHRVLRFVETGPRGILYASDVSKAIGLSAQSTAHASMQ